MDMLTILWTLASGSAVGVVLALVGGGGSILAVPLLVHVVGVTSTHVALGTSALAVALTALVNLVSHLRAGRIKVRCALVFSAAGIAGAAVGSGIAKQIDGGLLLALFGGLMVVVGIAMLAKRNSDGDPDVHLTMHSAGFLLPRLLPIGFTVGLLSGFFGIGGGFLIVPGLMLATGMPLHYALGTSLIAVAAFGLTTASNYALSGLIDWPIAGIFLIGGAIGGGTGIALRRVLAQWRPALGVLFAIIVIAMGGWIIWQAVMTA